MKIYADAGPRRTRQLIWDLIALALIALWIWIGVKVHDAIAQLGVVGDKMAGVGTSLNGDLTSMADKLGSVPVIGGGIRAPFESAADAANSITEAGEWQRETVDHLALIASIALVIAPIVAILALWLIPRLLWVRRAYLTAAVAAAPGGEDLLALRALVTRPMAELLTVHPDPANAWRAGDRAAISALAGAQRRAVGLN
ncbi:MAG: hypothetical protein NVV57_11640 [Demequina sp.]|jgi:hypothetical protein|nr:hypothetical protein [Demequina sp.]